MKSILYITGFIFFSTFGYSQKVKKIIDKDDPVKMQKYLDKGGDINEMIIINLQSDSNFQTHPLIYALGNKKFDCFEIIFNNRNEINNLDELISKAFILSLSRGNEDIMEMLYRENPNVNDRCVPCNNYSAIMVATRYGMENWYFKLKPMSDLNALSGNGNNLAHLAASCSNATIAKDVFNIEGMDLNLKDNIGFTPLDYAADNHENSFIFSILLDNGGDLNQAKNILYMGCFGIVAEIFQNEIMEQRVNDLWSAHNGYIPLAITALPDDDGVFWDDQMIKMKVLLRAMITEIKTNEAENYKPDYFDNNTAENIIYLSYTFQDEDEDSNVYRLLLELFGLAETFGKDHALTYSDYQYGCKLYGKDLINQWYDEFGLSVE